MARVLKITSGLMGVLLLMMVGVMGIGRWSRLGFTQLMVFNSGPSLYVTSPLQEYSRTISEKTSSHDFIDYMSVYLSPDQNWIYFRQYWVDQFGNQKISLYRSSLIHDHIDLINEDVVLDSVDRGIWPFDEFLIYAVLENGNHIALYLGEPDGRHPRPLTPNDIEMPSRGWNLILRGDWVYFNGDSPRDQTNIYRVKRDGTGLEKMFPESQHVYLTDVQPFAEHILLRRDGKLGWASLDGAVYKQLATDIRAKVDLDWIPDRQLLIISENGGLNLIAFQWNIQQPIWTLQNIKYLGYSPNQDWIMGVRDNQEMVRISTQDGNLFVLADEPVVNKIWGWTSDSHWFCTGGAGLYLTSLDGNSHQTLYQPQVYNVNLLEWADETHPAVFEDQLGYNRHLVFLLNSDKRTLTEVQTRSDYDMFMGWGPTINRPWQPAILTAIALTLILTPILITPCVADFTPPKFDLSPAASLLE